MSDSVRPHSRQPTRLPHPWDSPGKNTGVGCHFLLQCMKVESESEVAQSCPTLSNPMDCSLPGSSIHGIFQARVLEWGAIATRDLAYCNTFLAVFDFSPCTASSTEQKVVCVPWYSKLLWLSTAYISKPQSLWVYFRLLISHLHCFPIKSHHASRFAFFTDH